MGSFKCSKIFTELGEPDSYHACASNLLWDRHSVALSLNLFLWTCNEGIVSIANKIPFHFAYSVIRKAVHFSEIWPRLTLIDQWELFVTWTLWHFPHYTTEESSLTAGERQLPWSNHCALMEPGFSCELEVFFLLKGKGPQWPRSILIYCPPQLCPREPTEWTLLNSHLLGQCELTGTH